MSLKIHLREPRPEDFVVFNQKKKTEEQSVEKHFLEEDEERSLLQRIKKIDVKEEIESDFFQREKTLPPPPNGKIIEQFFSKDLISKKEKLPEKLLPLKVVRYFPVGRVRHCKKILVTFSQPMVALTALGDLPKSLISVQPFLPEGKWFYVNPQQICFEAKYRFFKATEYVVTIPKGLKSSLGGVLKKSVIFKFTLPSLKIKNFFPKERTPVKSDAIFFCEFDQKINKEVILEHLLCHVSNSKKKIPKKMKLLEKSYVVEYLKKKEEVEKDRFPELFQKYNFHLKNGIEENSIWFTFMKGLPLKRTFDFILKKGATSAEGQLKRKKFIRNYFSTFGSFKKSSQYPKKEDLDPPDVFEIEFSNPIDMEVFSVDFVSVKPKIKKMKVNANNSVIKISGKIRGNSKYTVTVLKSIMSRDSKQIIFLDVYGQELKKNVECTFKTGDPTQKLRGNTMEMISLNPFLVEPFFSVYVVNLEFISIKIYKVSPKEYNDVMFKKRNCKNPPKFVRFETKCVKDEESEVNIPLREYVQHPTEGVGQIIVHVEPDKKCWKGEWRFRPKIRTWVQITKLGLSAIGSTKHHLHLFATNFMKGKAVENAKFGFLYDRRLKTPRKSTPRKSTKLTSPISARGLKKEIKVISPRNQSTTDLSNVKTPKKKPKTTFISTKGNKDGIGMFNVLDYSQSNTAIAIVTKKKDVCFVTGINLFKEQGGCYKLFLYNDRNLYKPNETISIKGHLRFLHYRNGYPQIKVSKKLKLQYKVYDTVKEIKKGTIETNEKNGNFFLQFKLPDNMNLGTSSIKFENVAKKLLQTHYFDVDEFRTPQFKSTCSVDKSITYVVNSKAMCSASAAYYSGGNLSSCICRWLVSQSPGYYTPPGYISNGFRFSSRYKPINDKKLVGSVDSCEFTGKTDFSGNHQLMVEFSTLEDCVVRKPITISCQSTVQDLTYQTISASCSFCVHPADYYIGIKCSQPYIRVGEELKCSIIVCSIDGEEKIDVPIEISVIRRYVVRKGFRSFVKDEVVQKITTKSALNLDIDVKIKNEGKYFILANVEDEKSRKNFTSSNLIFVVGNVLETKLITQEKVLLVLNKNEYTPKEVAKVLVQGSGGGVHCEGLVLGFNSGLVFEERFSMTQNFCVVKVPIEDKFFPSLHLRVYLFSVDNDTEKNIKNPSFAMGTTEINVKATKNKLSVLLSPSKMILTPSENALMNVEVKDLEECKNVLVSLIIVDESILQITEYSIPDPFGFFYQKAYPQICERFSTRVVSQNQGRDFGGRITPFKIHSLDFSSTPRTGRGRRNRRRLYKSAKRPGSSRKKKKCKTRESSKSTKEKFVGVERIVSPQKAQMVETRKDFSPLVVFANDLPTDEIGKVSIPFKMKDSLSEYRVFAVATKGGNCFGIGEAKISCRLPISLIDSLPRFLNYGDSNVGLSVIVNNQTEKRIEVKVAVKVVNLELTGKCGYKISLFPQQRTTLTFTVRTVKCGKAFFQCIANVEELNFVDALEKKIPIFSPATSETFARFGSIIENVPILQPLKAPENVFKEYGGLSISGSSTAIQNLCDAFIYLYKYKFNCVEQCCSRVLAIVAVKDILEAFNMPKIPKKKKIAKVIKKSIETIEWSQNVEGFYRFWVSSPSPNVYLSIYAAFTLSKLKENGYRISLQRILRSKKFLMNIREYLSVDYDRRIKVSLQAYSLYVLTHMSFCTKKLVKENEKITILETAENLYRNSKKDLSVEGLCWIAFTIFHCKRKKATKPILQDIMQKLKNLADETNETCHFITSYGDDSKFLMLHSNRRTDAICLETLLHVDPQNTLIPKIVKGLLMKRKNGRWNSTQENFFVLLALKKYFEIFERIVPDFVSKIWIDDLHLGSHKFKGRTKDIQKVTVPMKHLMCDDKQRNICIFKQGTGREYWRMSLTYAKKEMKISATNFGFEVKRVYEPVTNKEHVKKINNVYHVKIGELVRVKITVVNSSVRVHVALVDYLPGGFEALNPDLKITETVKDSTFDNDKSFEYRWFDHQNFRDERVEAFSGKLYCGIHKYSYLARATSSGVFIVPPSKAEEMYNEEIFGRSDSEIVVIEDEKKEKLDTETFVIEDEKKEKVDTETFVREDEKKIEVESDKIVRSEKIQIDEKESILEEKHVEKKELEQVLKVFGMDEEKDDEEKDDEVEEEVGEKLHDLKQEEIFEKQEIHEKEGGIQSNEMGDIIKKDDTVNNEEEEKELSTEDDFED